MRYLLATFVVFFSVSSYALENFPNMTCKGDGEWKGVTGPMQTYTTDTKIADNLIQNTYNLNGKTFQYNFRVTFKENGFFDVSVEENSVQNIVGAGYCHDIQCMYKASFQNIYIEESLLFVHKKIYRLTKRVTDSEVLILQDVCKK